MFLTFTMPLNRKIKYLIPRVDDDIALTEQREKIGVIGQNVEWPHPVVGRHSQRRPVVQCLCRREYAGAEFGLAFKLHMLIL